MPRATKFWFKLSFGLGSLTLLVLWFEPREVLAHLVSADPTRAAVAVMLFALVMVIRSVRWQWILADLGVQVPFVRVLRAYAVGLYFNTFVPGGLGADLFKFYDAARATTKRLRPAAATVVERFTGILSLTAICFVSIVVFRDQLPVPAWLLAAVAGSIMAVSFAVLSGAAVADYLAEPLMRRLPETWQRGIGEDKIAALASVAGDLRGNPWMYVRTLLLGLAMQAVVLSTYFAIATAIDPRVPLEYVLVFFPLIDLTAMVPITFNGMGIKEALLLFFLLRAGLSSGVSLGMSILCRLIEFGFALLGGFVFFATRPPSER